MECNWLGLRSVGIRRRLVRLVFLAKLKKQDAVSRMQHFCPCGMRPQRRDTDQRVRFTDNAQAFCSNFKNESGVLVDPQSHQIGMCFQHQLHSPQAIPLQKMLIDNDIGNQIQPARLDRLVFALLNHDP